jgi:hypothetical protein
VNRFPWLGVAIWAWRGVVVTAARAGIWLPFLAVSLVQFGLLLLITGFHHAAFIPFGLPLVRFLGGEGATHYPALLYLLPTMFFRVNLIVSVLLASIAGGVATLLFARAFGFDAGPLGRDRVLRSAPPLIGVTFLIVGVLLGITLLGSLAPREAVLESGKVRWAMRLTVMALFVLVQSLLAYTTAWIVLMGHGIWASIRDSVRVTWRTFLPTLIAVGLPAVLLFPSSYATSRVDLVANRLKPEVITTLLVVQIVCQLLATFLLMGAVTRLFVWRLEEKR